MRQPAADSTTNAPNATRGGLWLIQPRKASLSRTLKQQYPACEALACASHALSSRSQLRLLAGQGVSRSQAMGDKLVLVTMLGKTAGHTYAKH